MGRTEHYWYEGLKNFNREECDAAFQEALAKLPTLDDLIAANEKDRDEYTCDVRRFHDFISFEVMRGEHVNVFSMCFKPGAKFTLTRGLAAGVERRPMELRQYVGGFGRDGKFEPGGEYSWSFPGRPVDRPALIERASAMTSISMVGDHRRGGSHNTYPARARDDTISLPDGSRLAIPQGLGGMIYRKIQDALTPPHG